MPKEREAYLDDLPPPDAGLPLDERAVMRTVHRRLFELDVTIAGIRRECGAYEHDLTCRFRYHVGLGIKEYLDMHKLALGKRLLRYDKLRVGEIALAVGYNSHGAFSTAFRRHEGCTPSAYRKMLR